jgi:hypothetical protein
MSHNATPIQDGIDPFLYFVLGMLRGEYKGETFSAIFEAVLIKVDKEHCGVGMQDFHYLPSLKDLGYTIWMASPSAYEILWKVIPMEHPRTIR